MRRPTDVAVAAAFAVAGFAVVLAPAVAVRSEVLNAGIGSLDEDVLAASALVGAAHAVLAWRRLLDEERIARRRLHVWIASLNALVALALGATLLLLVVLYLFPDEHASLAHRGYPVSALWAGVQAVAVLVAEAAGRVIFWWLEPPGENERGPTARRDAKPAAARRDDPVHHRRQESPGQLG